MREESASLSDSLMRRSAMIAMLLLVLGVVVLPELAVRRGTGRFILTLNLPAGSNIDPASIRYVECWTWRIAEMFARGDGFPADEWPELASVDGNQVNMTISSSFQRGFFGLIDTFRHPAAIVLQYDTAGNGQRRSHREIISIPTGRGDRTVFVDITHRD